MINMDHFQCILLLSVALFMCAYAQVIELNATTAAYYLSDYNTDNLLIEFYAPWCTHCKKLSPILDEIAKDSANIVKVLKVDATKNKDVAKSLNVTRYPTLFYRKEAAMGKYEGPRTYVGLQSFVERLTMPSYHVVNDIDELERHHFHDLHNITFVLEIPACSNDDTCPSLIKDIKQAFINVANRVYLKSALVIFENPKSDPATLLTPKISLCKYESYHTATMQDVFRPSSSDNAILFTTSQSLYCLDHILSDESHLESFIAMNTYPLITTFENHNFQPLAQLNKTMLILISDTKATVEEQEAVLSAFRTFAHRSITLQDASQLHPEEYIFGELDGHRWNSFVKFHEAKVPSLLIINHADEEHVSLPLITSSSSTGLSKEDKVADYLTIFDNMLIDLLAGNVLFSPTQKPSLWRKIKYRFEEYYPYSLLVILLPLVFIIVTFVFPFPKAKKIKRN